MRSHIFEQESVLDAPIEEVFQFFAEAENLQRITPDSLHFHILSPTPIELKQGALIWYRLRLHGIPMKWLTEITAWERPNRFVDSQRKGPYVKWEHEHRFISEGNATRMIDRVEYILPFGPLGQIAHKLFVRREIEAIFAHRTMVIQSQFPVAVD